MKRYDHVCYDASKGFAILQGQSAMETGHQLTEENAPGGAILEHLTVIDYWSYSKINTKGESPFWKETFWADCYNYSKTRLLN